MLPRHTFLVSALAIALGACATLQPDRPPERNAEVRLDRGLAALGAGRYGAAFDDLAWVYSHCPGREAGSRALTALAALELDPRNRAGRPDVAAGLIAEMIRDSGTPHWLRPLAETTFLTALALGAPSPDHDPTDRATADDTADAMDPDAMPLRDRPQVARRAERPGALEPTESTAEPTYGCGPMVRMEGWVAPALPVLPGPSMAAMLRQVERERDSLALHADTLRTQLATAREQLAATREELERIRRTLKP